jgi:death-on-curing protein
MNVIYLSKSHLIAINRMTINQHGGSFLAPTNILHEDRLDYLLDAVDQQVFGETLHPTISSKAAVYFYHIVTGHVFHDGNKRTGLAAALVFLQLNGYTLRNELVGLQSPVYSNDDHSYDQNANEILYAVTMQIASGSAALIDCQRWLKSHIIPTSSY